MVAGFGLKICANVWGPTKSRSRFRLYGRFNSIPGARRHFLSGRPIGSLVVPFWDYLIGLQI